MGIAVFIGLLVTAALLFLAVVKKWISSKILQTLAEVATVVALIAAATVFVVPSATSPAPSPQPSSPEPELQATSPVPGSTDTPIALATSTPSSTATATQVPTPSSIPTLVVLDIPPPTGDTIVFSWNWEGELASDMYYQVRISRADDQFSLQSLGRLQSPEFWFHIDNRLFPAGEYYLHVAVIQLLQSEGVVDPNAVEYICEATPLLFNIPQIPIPPRPTPTFVP